MPYRPSRDRECYIFVILHRVESVVAPTTTTYVGEQRALGLPLKLAQEQVGKGDDGQVDLSPLGKLLGCCRAPG